MTTPSSGQISLQDIMDEIYSSETQTGLGDSRVENMIENGATAPNQMSEWYSSYSGIGLDNNWGTTTYTESDTSSSGAQGYAEVRLGINSNGLFSITDEDNGNDTQRYQIAWRDSGWRATNPEAYQVKWVKVSGADPDNTNMTENTWTTLTSQYIYVRSTGALVNGVYDVTIRQSNRAWSEVTQRFDMSATWTGDSVLWTTSAKSTTTLGVGSTDFTGFRWNTDGTCDSTTSSGAWGNENEDDAFSGTASNFEIRYTSFSGDALNTSIGTSGSWYPLSSLRQMSYTGGGSSAKSCSFTITVRKLNDSGSEVSCTVTLNQNYEP